jgi:hypothetical protein
MTQLSYGKSEGSLNPALSLAILIKKREFGKRAIFTTLMIIS